MYNVQPSNEWNRLCESDGRPLHSKIQLVVGAHRFVLEIVTGVYDNGSPALIGWLAFLAIFHAIVVIVLL